MTHFVVQCIHGHVVSQCRCPSNNKSVKIVSCDEVIGSHPESRNDTLKSISEIEYAKVTIVVQRGDVKSTYTLPKVADIDTGIFYESEDIKSYYDMTVTTGPMVRRLRFDFKTLSDNGVYQRFETKMAVTDV